MQRGFFFLFSKRAIKNNRSEFYLWPITAARSSQPWEEPAKISYNSFGVCSLRPPTTPLKKEKFSRQYFITLKWSTLKWFLIRTTSSMLLLQIWSISATKNLSLTYWKQMDAFDVTAESKTNQSFLDCNLFRVIKMCSPINWKSCSRGTTK